MKTRIALYLVAAAFIFASGCGSDDETVTAVADSTGDTDTPVNVSFTLSSSSIKNGEAIPDKYTCEDEGGSDISPQLSWDAAPEGTVSFAIIMDDEITPCGTGDDACMHWSVFNIAADVTSLGEGADLSAVTGVTEGRNYTGAEGYAGPCPPETHVYKISIYALGEGAPMVAAGEAFTRSSFEAEYAGSILASDTIEGTFTP